MIKKWLMKCIKEAVSEALSELGAYNRVEKAEEKDTDMRVETAQDGEFNGMSHEIFNEWVYGKVKEEE